jgi:hypothetical protein
MIYDEILAKVGNARGQILGIIKDNVIYYDDLQRIIHFNADADYIAKAIREILDIKYAHAVEIPIYGMWNDYGAIILSEDLVEQAKELLEKHYK